VVDDRIADYGFVIVDECHHISAVSFERVLMEAKAKRCYKTDFQISYNSETDKIRLRMVW